ncbi:MULTISPECIES: hypothetical protein [Staphylococcus]|nr:MULTISPECIES: hypothetical protein [Staphylococcus]
MLEMIIKSLTQILITLIVFAPAILKQLRLWHQGSCHDQDNEPRN